MRGDEGSRRFDEPDDGALLALFGAIASGDHRGVTRRLDEAPDLATWSIRIGATRQDPQPYFLPSIRHYVYAGDTALHRRSCRASSGALRARLAQGADVQARNRRGAEPLHYAADGSPGADNSIRDAQPT